MRFISLEDSFVYLNPKETNCWRVSVKSVLIDEKDNKSYYLTKECRAERISKYPFSHPAKSELCVVVDNKKNAYKIRDIPVLKRNDFGEHYYQRNFDTSDELQIKETLYRKLEFREVFDALKNRKLGNIYSKFSFEYQSKNYQLFTKVEYLNFNGEKNDNEEYLQPIFGYVPFLKDGNIHIGYVVKYIEKNDEGNLEFRLRTNKPFINFVPKPNRLTSKILFLLLRIITFPIKVSEFEEVISLTKSNLSFFEVCDSQK